MITFRCKNCNKKVSVNDMHCGKRVKCPQCGQICVIPDLTAEGMNSASKDLSDSRIQLQDVVLDTDIEDDTANPEEEPSDSQMEQPEQKPRRKLPWIIDIFLYPTSVSGLTILGIYVFTPVVPHLIGLGLSVVFSRLYISILLVLALAAIDLVVTAYMFWYFGMCTRESTLGKVRAPETYTNVADGTLEMVVELAYIVSCLIICLGPSLTYCSITNRLDWIYWLLLGCGVFFLPMVLLAIIMFGSLSAINPLLIIPSIFSTFSRYWLTLLAFCVPVGIAVAVSICLPKHTIGVVGYLLRGIDTILTFATGLPIALPKHTIGIISFLLRGIYAYLALVAAHILGRFYYRNQEKLNWEV